MHTVYSVYWSPIHTHRASICIYGVHGIPTPVGLALGECIADYLFNRWMCILRDYTAVSYAHSMHCPCCRMNVNCCSSTSCSRCNTSSKRVLSHAVKPQPLHDVVILLHPTPYVPVLHVRYISWWSSQWLSDLATPTHSVLLSQAPFANVNYRFALTALLLAWHI